MRVPVVGGNGSQKNNLSNFHRSFPLKVLYLSDSEVKLEALFVRFIMSFLHYRGVET